MSISVCLNSDVRFLTAGSKTVLSDCFSKCAEIRVFQVKLILGTVDILQRCNWPQIPQSSICTVELGPS